MAYTFILQHDWCTSKRTVPCSLLRRSRRVGQSRCVGKKKRGEGEKKTVYDCRAIVDAVVEHSTPGPFRIRIFQQNLGYIQIYPDISVGTFSPSNVRAKRKTLLESSPHAQTLRGKTDENKMLLRAGSHCLQDGALSESLFRSPCSTLAETPPSQMSRDIQLKPNHHPRNLCN